MKVVAVAAATEAALLAVADGSASGSQRRWWPLRLPPCFRGPCAAGARLTGCLVFWRSRLQKIAFAMRLDDDVVDDDDDCDLHGHHGVAVFPSVG